MTVDDKVRVIFPKFFNKILFSMSVDLCVP